MAGRKPKPTAIKKLEGNPGKRKLNTKEPVPAKGKGCKAWCCAFFYDGSCITFICGDGLHHRNHVCDC